MRNELAVNVTIRSPRPSCSSTVPMTVRHSPPPPAAMPSSSAGCATVATIGANGDITVRNEKRRRLEENLALVCMAYTLVFLLCNSLRIFIDCHELYNLAHANECQKAGN